MKKVSTKSLMVITLVVASFTATPMMVAGYDYDDNYTYDQIGITDPSALIGGFGNIFGLMFRGLGGGGDVLATVFEMLFMQTLTNFNGSEILPGVYAISATHEDNKTFVRNFNSTNKQRFFVPYDYMEGNYNVSQYGNAYCEVERSGTIQYNLTVGAGVTLIIWDKDGSFVNAVEKIIKFFTDVQPYLPSPSTSSPSTSAPSTIGGIPDELIQRGVELITWFLIHINDIFTGEELFVLNPITWQKLDIKTSLGFSINKTWKVTGLDGLDNFDETLLAAMSGDNSTLVAWNITAHFRKDSYMEWLFTEDEVVANLGQTFTSFTFDVFQLWVKKFEIHIDVGAILSLLGGGGGSGFNPAAIFQGLNIEFYLFTHHLTGAFLYNDTATGPIPDGKLSANYTQVTDNFGAPVVDSMGDPVEVPRSSELTHRLMLGSVNDFNFALPAKNGNKVSWGLTLDNATLIPVPVGVDADSYLGATPEFLSYIHFGFTFEPKETMLATTDGGTVPVLHGAVKLDQFFAPWNNDDAPFAKNPIDGLDLAIIYVSTVLHFRLSIDTIGDDPLEGLDPDEDYDETTHSLKIGNYLPHNIRDKLDFVDIAGPDYFYGAEGTTDSAPANTSILPVALFEAEASAHQTFEGTPGEVDTFAADIGLNITFSVMVYAVCFPMFEDGSGIWHDPVFSVFMVFEPTGFWALILLVAGVGLLGVATILIKRRKDSRS
ncbi:MAG: hypothetical protein KGD74_09880 [Candidatus Lokiarchaeota archaeon]|nr:hypothetical protein [Candidatus Lokiarchaeota archaeon]